MMSRMYERWAAKASLECKARLVPLCLQSTRGCALALCMLLPRTCRGRLSVLCRGTGQSAAVDMVHRRPELAQRCSRRRRVRLTCGGRPGFSVTPPMKTLS